jgi:predicted enzyme related to lactoylglutathione lyase
MKNMLNWFEIPVSDFERGKKFYETIFGCTIHGTDFGGVKMGFLPSDQGKVSGALCAGPDYKPSKDGSLLYLNANPDLNEVLNRVEAAGGKILMAKRQITPEYGYSAVFVDSEGNRMALHSNN